MSELNTVNMTATEIDGLKVAREKELKIAQSVLNEVELKTLELSKEICKLQLDKKDLQIALTKAKHTAKTISLDVKILTSEFWRARDNR